MLRVAATKLEAAGRSTALDGYVSASKARVWEMAEGIWAAAVELRIRYVLPPASFEKSGQKVRSPGEILERRVGTCLDTSLFYAACLEQAGLQPLIVLTAGHAFVGLWLSPDLSSASTIDNIQVLRNSRDLEEIIFVETTLLTDPSLIPFNVAVQGGSADLDEGKLLEVAIDVSQARQRSIRPLDLGDRSFVPQQTGVTESPLEMAIGEPPKFAEDVKATEQAEEAGDRLTTWKRKLLDLTLANKLLNFKGTKSSIELECSDLSQLSAVLAAAKGKNFVLFGPPGTGKSQTITNMIAQCLAEKKTVLFVAQKTAALEVVMRRLKEIGLQDHALEIHSAKAQKSVVLAQLKEAWHNRSPSSARNWTEATVELKELRNKLNLLVAALHEERPNGLTAYQAFSVIVANRDRFQNIAFVPVDDFEPNRPHLQALKTFARDLERGAKAVCDFANHPLAEIKTTNWSPVWASQLVQTCEELARAIPTSKNLVTTFSARIGADHFSDHQNTFLAFVRLEELLAREGIGKARFFLGTDGQTVRQAADKLLAAQESRAKLQKRCSVAFRPSVFTVDLKDLTRQWNEANKAFFLFRYFRKSKVRRQLQPHTDGKVPGDIRNDLFLLSQIDALQREASGLESLKPLFGVRLDWYRNRNERSEELDNLGR